MEQVRVKNTLDALVCRLKEGNNFLSIQTRNGRWDNYTCRFNPPASLEKINLLRSVMGYTFPEEYETLMFNTDGCELFAHPTYGGENMIYCIDDVIRYNRQSGYPQRVRVGYIYADNLVIDLEIYRSGDQNYMFVCDSTSHLSESRPLYCSFEIWFDRFIMSNGVKYWDWL